MGAAKDIKWMIKMEEKKQVVIEIHAMTPGMRALLDKAWAEYQEQQHEEIGPYGVLYWFIRWSRTFQEFAGKQSERVVTVGT